jgi:LemA protein
MLSREQKLLIIGVIIIAFLIGMIVPYNTMVTLKNNVLKQEAQIENVLQARLEKIPDLVTTVKSYVEHEEKVFTAVAEARSGLQKAIDEGDIEKMSSANEALSTALGNLNVVVEAYPELKASELYIGLMDEISGAVNRISQERRLYNETVSEYNDRIETFPFVMYAKILGFEPFPYFKADKNAHESSVVDFGD